ncbi:MAG: ATP-dependent DNA helicase RecG [Deltaproteobacteria bacterium]|nr:ATP-dependent DNA helicase RecG [Deltaproteobacteria bacterium]
MSEILKYPLQYVKGVGPRLAELFSRKDVETVGDAFQFLPRTYEDRRTFTPIVKLKPGLKQTSLGKISSLRVIPLRNRKLKILECVVSDQSGSISLKWFRYHAPTMRKMLKSGCSLIFTGEVQEFRWQKQIVHPDFEIVEEDEHKDLLHFGRIVPIYSETGGLYQKTIRRVLKTIVENYSDKLEDPLPEVIRNKHALISLKEAYQEIHFPHEDVNIEDLLRGESEARRRLIFDEFFFLELGLALKKSQIKSQKTYAFVVLTSFLENFSKKLPFKLTGAQFKVLDEIIKDLVQEKPMNRLVQGDVGSGKTVVSMGAALLAFQNGFQVAIMAPTEILAHQHFLSFEKILSRFDKKIGLSMRFLVSALGAKEKKAVYREIEQGVARIIIGTHALIQEDLTFQKLGLVVVDEQHRFGVDQRKALSSKGQEPHVLVMTATPIPRTLALTAYGELDVSVIDEMPQGRKPIQTHVLLEKQKDKLYRKMGEELSKGRQIYYIYPLIEESEKIDLKDATEGAKNLKNIFSSYQVELLHGKMNQNEKDKTMEEFKKGKIHILVSTTVVEVGVDVPNATLMVVEHAERFGLSQLHQLRGRVGRSDLESYCYLLSSLKNWDEEKNAVKRLKIMEETTNGFLISEEDLKIRGPGEFLGTRQAGFVSFRVADLLRDHELLKLARREAFYLIYEDPRLEKEEHHLLKETFEKLWSHKFKYATIG